MRSGTEHGDQVDALARVEGGIQDLARLGLRGMDPDETLRYVRRVGRAVDQLRLLFTVGTAELDRVGAEQVTGAVDIVGFVATEFGLTPEAAKEHVVFARQLDRLGDTVNAVTEGDLSFDAASVVSRTAAKMRPEDVAEVQARILADSHRMAPGELRRHAQLVAAEVDAEVLRRDATRAREKRSLRIGPDTEGVATISGCLTSMCAAELRRSLEPYMCPADKDDRRTAEQRRHDALHELCRFEGRPGENAGARRIKGRTDVLVVAGPEAMSGDDGSPPLLQGLVPISQDELDQLLDGDPGVAAAIKDDKGNVAYGGRSARLFSRAKKRAMVAVSPTCVFDGCTRPSVNSTAHHIVEFSQGGETTIDNGAHLCFPHQERVHRDGWAVLRDPAGGFRTLPPGHADNPRSRLTPGDYLRWRRKAMLKRVLEKANRGPLGARRQAPAGRSPGPEGAAAMPPAPP